MLTFVLQEYCEYFGDVNVSNMPRSYDECVGRILRYCENNSQFKNIPWLVNTMGFTNGLGAKVNNTHLVINDIDDIKYSRIKRLPFFKQMEFKFVMFLII